VNKNDADLGALYRETVMDHYRSPRGHKILDRIDIMREGHNPVCGDKVKLSVKMSDEGVEDVAVDCKGCAISVASASMLAELGHIDYAVKTGRRDVRSAMEQMVLKMRASA